MLNTTSNIHTPEKPTILQEKQLYEALVASNSLFSAQVPQNTQQQSSSTSFSNSIPTQNTRSNLPSHGSGNGGQNPSSSIDPSSISSRNINLTVLPNYSFLNARTPIFIQSSSDEFHSSVTPQLLIIFENNQTLEAPEPEVKDPHLIEAEIPPHNQSEQVTLRLTYMNLASKIKSVNLRFQFISQREELTNQQNTESNTNNVQPNANYQQLYPAHYACIRGDLQELQHQLQNHDINELDCEGNSLLYVATLLHHQHIASYLLQHGADWKQLNRAE